MGRCQLTCYNLPTMSHAPARRHASKAAPRQMRIIALLVAASLLLGMVLGSGFARAKATPTGLSNSVITQLILQDICRAHPASGLKPAELQSADGHVPRESRDSSSDSSSATNASFPADSGDTSDPSSKPAKHSHCAACLIALDISLPEHGSTWRLKAAQLALQRPIAAVQSPLTTSPLKPPSHAPPVPV